MLADARAEGNQGVDESQVVERLGAQLACDPADLVQAFPDGVRDATKLARRQRRLGRERSASCAASAVRAAYRRAVSSRSSIALKV